MLHVPADDANRPAWFAAAAIDPRARLYWPLGGHARIQEHGDLLDLRLAGEGSPPA